MNECVSIIRFPMSHDLHDFPDFSANISIITAALKKKQETHPDMSHPKKNSKIMVNNLEAIFCQFFFISPPVFFWCPNFSIGSRPPGTLNNHFLMDVW